MTISRFLQIFAEKSKIIGQSFGRKKENTYLCRRKDRIMNKNNLYFGFYYYFYFSK